MLFGNRFGVRVMAEPTLRIGRRLVDVPLALALERNARAAGEHQPSHAVGQAPVHHVPSAHGIDSVEVTPRAANARRAPRVKHDVHALTGGCHRPPIPQIAANHVDPQAVKERIARAAECAYTIPSCEQLLDEIATEKSARAGNQYVQVFSD